MLSLKRELLGVQFMDTYAETMQWVEESKEQREAELNDYQAKMDAIRARNADREARLGVVAARLDKIESQLAVIKEEIAAYEAAKLAAVR